jgi:aspartyl-tRNA(Asn)/glutamyl-tRNA(Gln) amidotransferase subunit C
MKLSLEQVRHVASLARLALTPEEEARAQSQLSAILEAVDTLASLDTTDVPPTSHVLDSSQRLRADEVVAPLSLDQVLGNAPAKQGTSFVIPAVIE